MQPSPSTELRLSAKELRYVGSRLVQSQEVADRLVGAANWTLLQAEAPGLQKLLETLLDLCGGVTIAMLSADDEPVLFVPVSVIRNGKEELGAVTTLVDRVIVAWTEGTFRLTYCGSAISVADVRNVEMTAGDFDIELRATTDSTEWHLRFSRRHTTVDEETNLTQFVVNTLSGKALAEEKGQANDPDVTPSGSAAVSDDEPTDGSASIGG